MTKICYNWDISHKGKVIVYDMRFFWTQRLSKKYYTSS